MGTKPILPFCWTHFHVYTDSFHFLTEFTHNLYKPFCIRRYSTKRPRKFAPQNGETDISNPSSPLQGMAPAAAYKKRIISGKWIDFLEWTRYTHDVSIIAEASRSFVRYSFSFRHDKART